MKVSERCVRKVFGVVFAILLLSAGFAESSAKKFEGLEITVGVQKESAIGEPAIAHAKTWEQKTGGKVRIVQMPFGEMFSRFMIPSHQEKASLMSFFMRPRGAETFIPICRDCQMNWRMMRHLMTSTAPTETD